MSLEKKYAFWNRESGEKEGRWLSTMTAVLWWSAWKKRAGSESGCFTRERSRCGSGNKYSIELSKGGFWKNLFPGAEYNKVRIVSLGDMVKRVFYIFGVCILSVMIFHEFQKNTPEETAGNVAVFKESSSAPKEKSEKTAYLTFDEDRKSVV